MKINLVSLGCARNLVDSEIMLGRASQAGWEITPDPAEADAIVVNTCSFIESAVQESVDTILELAEYKTIGRCRKLIVTGCLPERYRGDLAETLPEVDAFLGAGAYDRIIAVLENRSKPPQAACLLPDPSTAELQRSDTPRIVSTARMAYLKIAEGCSKHCTYCLIPRLRGSLRSRSSEDIVTEARSLIDAGVRELVLVAQDSTAYGRDLDPPENLAPLLGRLAELSKTVWIRFLYGSPESIDNAVIDAVSNSANICPYFDIPIQHAAGPVLQRMGRRYLLDDLRRLFDTIRKKLPDAALRTTAMVGFPGETEEHFQLLLDFIQEIRFDHLGAFIYSDTEELPSFHLAGKVDPETAARRHRILMQTQAGISLERNRRHIGKTVAVLIEGQQKDGLYFGRTMKQAPEVDGITLVTATKALPIHDIVPVAISGATEYDIMGNPA